MSLKLAQRLSAVAPSVTLAMNAKAQELRSRGVDVVPFGVGEPDFDPAPHVLGAAKYAIDHGASKYTAVTGIAPLKNAIGKSTERMRGHSPTPNMICVSVGAKHVLFNLALALYDPGDEVVLPAPYWVSYPEQVRLVGATPVIVDTTEAQGFRMSPEQLRSALTPRTKAVVLCTPSNPTGAAYSESELRALLDVLRDHECFIIVDEIYGELVYDGFKHVSVAAIAPELRDRIIIVDGVSKTYAMTGWRIGWAIAPPRIIAALDVIQGQSTTNATAVAQHAAVAALEGPLDQLHEMRDVFQKRRDVMIAGLNSIAGIRCGVPQGAFYAFADCRGLYGIPWNETILATDEQIAFFLLDKAHVATVPGGPFGAPGYVRFSYATSEELIRRGIASMQRAVDEARGSRSS